MDIILNVHLCLPRYLFVASSVNHISSTQIAIHTFIVPITTTPPLPIVNRHTHNFIIPLSQSLSFSDMTTNTLSFKIVVVGEAGVGKSSIVERLVQGTFREDGTSTCGADFCTYVCPVDSETVRLQIWDTAGQERFKSISRSYFRNAVGAILVYDLTSIPTFDHLSGWLNDLLSIALPNAYILLVGNKADLDKEREVGAQMVREFANRHHLESLETSALTGKGVKEAFARLAFEVYHRLKNNQIIPAIAGRTFTQEKVEGQISTEKECC
jgi:small GTP-binding protein